MQKEEQLFSQKVSVYVERNYMVKPEKSFFPLSIFFQIFIVWQFVYATNILRQLTEQNGSTFGQKIL